MYARMIVELLLQQRSREWLSLQACIGAILHAVSLRKYRWVLSGLGDSLHVNVDPSHKPKPKVKI